MILIFVGVEEHNIFNTPAMYVPYEKAFAKSHSEKIYK